MIVIEANIKSITAKLFNKILGSYDRGTGARMSFRVNGKYGVAQKDIIRLKCMSYRIPILHLDVFRSAVTEENRLEITIGVK